MAVLRNTICVLLITFTIIGCHSEVEHSILMDKACTLYPSEVVDDSISASHVFVLCDSIQVHQLPYLSGGPVLGWKKVGTDSISYWGEYGRRDGRIMSPLVSRNGNMILINDFVKKQIWVLTVTAQGLSNIAGPIDSDIKSQCVIPVSNHDCLYLNPHSFITGRQRVLLSKNNFKPANCIRTKYNCMNVLHGSIATNGRGKIVYVDYVTSHVEILDESGHLETIIEKENLEHQEYYTDSKEIVFMGYVCQSFIDVCPFKNGFAALYRPMIISDKDSINNDESEIYVFDWNGNQCSHYVIRAVVENLSLSYDGRFLFCFESMDGNKKLSVYEL